MNALRICALSLLVVCAAQAEPPSGATASPQSELTLTGAKKGLAAAVAHARNLGAPGGAIAVVDGGGTLLAFERLDGTFDASANVAIGKARTAAIFKQRTRVFEELVNNGRIAMTALGDFTPLIGGVPIVIDGETIGAIGVSGAASAAQDEEIALAGAGALTGSARPLLSRAPIHLFEADAVRAAFAKGDALIETGGYKVHASRRTGPGQVEVHDDETDVIYVVDGSAVLVIPAGVPHWFKEVRAPFLYFTVKPIAPVGAVL